MEVVNARYLHPKSQARPLPLPLPLLLAPPLSRSPTRFSITASIQRERVILTLLSTLTPTLTPTLC